MKLYVVEEDTDECGGCVHWSVVGVYRSLSALSEAYPGTDAWVEKELMPWQKTEREFWQGTAVELEAVAHARRLPLMRVTVMEPDKPPVRRFTT